MKLLVKINFSFQLSPSIHRVAAAGHVVSSSSDFVVSSPFPPHQVGCGAEEDKEGLHRSAAHPLPFQHKFPGKKMKTHIFPLRVEGMGEKGT